MIKEKDNLTVSETNAHIVKEMHHVTLDELSEVNKEDANISRKNCLTFSSVSLIYTDEENERKKYTNTRECNMVLNTYISNEK